MKRIGSLLLTVSLLLGLLTACAGDDSSQKETEDTTAQVTELDTAVESAEGTTGRENAKDNIPADLTFKGETVRVLYRADDYFTKWDVEGTDNAGDLVTDAVWERNRKVEERFGLTINPIKTQNSSDVKVYIAEVKSTAMSGSDEFDIITAGGGATVQSGLYPYLMELSDMNYLDIDSPWWFTDAIRGLSFDGEHYRYLLGDNMLVDYLKAGVMFYNKDIYTDIKGGADADEMYQIVLDGTWTYDFLTELVTEAYADLNGDGQQNSGDRFGLMLPRGVDEATPHMLFGCDIVTFERTKDNGIDLSAMNNERNILVLEKLIPLVHNTVGSLITDRTIDSPAYFTENQTLFWTGRLSNVTHGLMRDMQSDYGILPMPKYDEEQKEYISYTHSSATFTCVLKSVPNERRDLIGAFLEGWSAEAYRTVITPFIESAIKLKYSRDELSGQIIDVIFGNMYIDFTNMFNANINGLYQNALANSLNKGENIFASQLGSLLVPGQKSLDNYIMETLETED